MDAIATATFQAWADPVIDRYGEAPEGTLSRLGWLPLMGPSAWLIWGTLTGQLHREANVTWDLAELAAAHGLGRSTARRSAIARTLARMEQFRILAGTGPGQYLVRLTVPPMGRGMLDRLPSHVVELHRQIYGTPQPRSA